MFWICDINSGMSRESSWPGFYIAFEGGTKCGKTTQLFLLADKLRSIYGDWRVVETREPGGTIISQVIRNLVQVDEYGEEMTKECEAYLYAASRAQSLRRLVEPALREGKIVIADRSYISSLVFQGWAGGLGVEKVERINADAVGNIKPDLPIFLDVKLSTILSRPRDISGDKHERKGNDFYEDVYQGYLMMLAISELGIVRVDGNGTIPEVSGRINSVVLESLNERSNFRSD